LSPTVSPDDATTYFPARMGLHAPVLTRDIKKKRWSGKPVTLMSTNTDRPFS
jgi:hypothetical protein